QIQPQRHRRKPGVEQDQLEEMLIGACGKGDARCRRRAHTMANARKAQELDGALKCRRTFDSIDGGIYEFSPELLRYGSEHGRESMTMSMHRIFCEVVTQGCQEVTLNGARRSEGACFSILVDDRRHPPN